MERWGEQEGVMGRTRGGDGGRGEQEARDGGRGGQEE